jgi:hypothetical protein
MRKVSNAVNLAAIGFFAIATSACSTITYKSSEDWQNKIWRGPVVKTILDTSTWTPDPAYMAATKFDVASDIGIRIARVHISTGWSSTMANTVIPDSIEFSQIPKGTLVDVMAEFGPNVDHGKQRYTRILRIVCASTDVKCIDAEKAAHRYQAVIDASPAAETINAKYGLTFNRRVTKAEVAKYD